jgi:hypothetical protein
MAKRCQSERTTPYGMWRYGNDFRRAANYVLIHEHSKFFMPVYFLFGQLIELSMKAFLLARGTSMNVLRRKAYGHNLVALLEECKRRRIGRQVKLDVYDIAAIRILNLTYEPRRLQYIETGLMQLPETRLVHDVAEKLSVELENYCHNATKW